MTQIDRPITNTIVWGELATPNLEKARAFYGELLGWSFIGGDEPRTGYYTMATLGGRQVVGLWQQGAETQSTGLPSTWSVYFGSDDCDATAAMTSAGGQLIMPPMDVMSLGRMALGVDPTGAAFGVWQSKEHKGSQLLNEPGAMTWHEVYTRDASAAREFYGKVFGLEARKLAGSTVDYWSLHLGERTVAGLMQMTDQFPKEAPPRWNTYFAVADTDVATAKLQKLGGRVLQPAFDTPYGRMSAVADPQGAAFCLIKPASAG
jgi:uncharacterized protein